jgi:teichoic acid D-alanine hydrolase
MRYIFILYILWNCFSLSPIVYAHNYEEIIQKYYKNNNFNGAVLIAQNESVLYKSGVGLSNREEGTSINSQSLFKIASVTKVFTSLIILHLYEKGVLNLHQTIGKYYPEYSGEGKERVTLHHLLTHSSGITHCEGSNGIAVYQSPYSVDEFIRRYCSGTLDYEPGSQFRYNNADYIILGRIIEKITGKSFSENLHSIIVQPLQLQHTAMLYHKDVIKGLASTYYIDDSTKIFYRDAPMYIENYFSAGAMYSTVDDIFRLDKALFSSTILQKSTFNLMMTPYPALYNVAYGLWVSQQKFGEKTYKVANRQGSIWGANAYWIHIMDNNITIIIVSNTNATNLHTLAEEFALETMKN